MQNELSNDLGLIGRQRGQSIMATKSRRVASWPLSNSASPALGLTDGFCAMNITSLVAAWIFAVAWLLLTGCAVKDNRPDLGQYSFEITDNPNERSFDIVLKSHAIRPLCISIENWPSRDGQLHMGSSLATLELSESSLPARDDNFGYCPGGCGQYRIEAGEELRGFITYAVFGEPERLVLHSSKRLQFSVSPHYCRHAEEQGQRLRKHKV